MPEILVVSTSVDMATDRVIDKLCTISECSIHRLNTEDFPYRNTVTIQYPNNGQPWFVFSNSTGELDSRKIHSVWFRRIRRSTCPDAVEPLLHHYVSNESVWTLRGALSLLGDKQIRWVNSPNGMDIAENKIHQLMVAGRLGLQIPPTLVSSSPDAIIQFARSGTTCITKPVRSGYIETSEGAFAAYTRRLTDADLSSLQDDDVLPSPVIVQHEIPKAFDIRVTVVGGRIFAARIHSQNEPESTVDWRRTEDPHLTHSRIDLPDKLIQKCLQLNKILNLQYSAIDFIETESEEFIFLEINPGGQWLWIEDTLGYPISAAIAQLLYGGAPS